MYGTKHSLMATLDRLLCSILSFHMSLKLSNLITPREMPRPLVLYAPCQGLTVSLSIYLWLRHVISPVHLMWSPCRRRKGEAVPRADNFGDLITADHKVLSDNCESRNNHRYAVVVQDLATQWIQAYPCKNKTSQETLRSLQKFLEPERKTKSHLH